MGRRRTLPTIAYHCPHTDRPKHARGLCKACYNDAYFPTYVREWTKARPHYRRNLTHGTTQTAIEKQLAAQNHSCAICHNPLTVPQVDHDHKTEKVRGLLCRACNLGLGHFKDSPTIMRSAIQYVETYDKLSA